MARATRSKKRSLAIPKGRHIHEPIRLDSMFHGDICSKAEIIDSRLGTKAFYTVKFRGLFFLFFPVDNNATGTLVTGKSRPTSRFANTHATVFRFIYIYIRMDARFYRRISRRFFFFLLSSSLFRLDVNKSRSHLPLVSSSSTTSWINSYQPIRTEIQNLILT